MVLHVNRLGGIGDVLMTTSALKKLKRSKPNIEIVYHTSKVCAPILEKNPDISKVVIEEDSSKFMPLQVPMDFRYKLNKPLPSDVHHSEFFSNNFNLTGAGVPFIFTEDIKIDERDYITIHPFPGYTENKFWNGWQKIIDWLSPKVKVILLGSDKDPLLKNVIDKRGLNLRESAAYIRDSIIHLGVDSWTNHACPAVGKTGVIVFGSTSPFNFGYTTNVNISSSEFCNPCWKEPTPLTKWKDDICSHKSCMKKISVDVVKHCIFSLLEQKGFTISKPEKVDNFDLALVYRSLNDRRNAKSVFSSLVGNNKYEEATILKNLGELSNGKEAIGYYEKLLKFDKSNDLIFARVAKLYTTIGVHDKSLEYYYKALSINPSNPLYYYEVSNILFDHGKIEESIQLYRKAINFAHPLSALIQEKLDGDSYSYSISYG